MITHEKSAEILASHVKQGGRLVAAAHASIPAAKELLETCLNRDIPATLGPCSHGG